MADNLIAITLTDWEKERLLILLNNQDLAKASLGVMAEALELRDTFKQEGNDVTITQQQFTIIKEIALNPNLKWPITEEALELYNKLKEPIK